MSTTAWTILLIANIPVYWLLGWVVFQQWDEFFESVRFWLTPDIFSAFRGEYGDSQWANLRLFLWAVLCAVSIYGEYSLLTKHLLHH